MKTALFLSCMILGGYMAGAQDTTRAAAPQLSANADGGKSLLKTWDQYLPAWSIDASGRVGWLSQNVNLIDFNQAFPQSQKNSSNYVNPTFSNGRSGGADIQVSWFFSNNRRWGIGLGAMYMNYSGDMELGKDFKADFHYVDDRNRPYRQIITFNEPLRENLKISNINAPLLLKYKWTFAHRGEQGKLGLTLEGGPVFGLYSQTKTSASGSLNFEAIYKIELREGQQFFVFDVDNDSNRSFQTFLLTRDAIPGDDQAEFEKLRAQNEGWNVGLNLPIAESQRNQKNELKKISFGGMVQAGVSYHLSYNLAFLASGYLMYQQWQARDNENYRFTGNVVGTKAPLSASYNPIAGAIRNADYISYGVQAGFRLYFGGKKDIDGDGVPDALDDCREKPGRFNGCPDSDGDGISDAYDECPGVAGLARFNGCPDVDEDGVDDRYDKCIGEKGTEETEGCIPIAFKIKAAIDSTRASIDSTFQHGNEYVTSISHIVLTTTVLYFDFNRTNITKPSAAILDNAADVLSKEPKTMIYLGAHTDNIGGDLINLALSYQRAKNSRDYLISKGVPKERIIIGGHGKEDPVTPNNTAEERARNRRLEMKILLPL